MSEEQEGERDFLDRIDRNQGILHRVVALYAHGAEERRDLLQEILFQLWRARRGFRGQAKFSTWVYRIALNTAITGLRQARRRPLVIPLGELESASRGVQDSRVEELQAAIRSLPAVDRAIVLLHLEERSYDEIAEILGISTGHVGVKLTRIRQKLRDQLGQ